MPRNDSGQLEPGSVLAGRYRIERFLAGGGMGLVYIAHDQRLADRRCAIKEIFDRFNNPEEREHAIEYFHREADTLAQLKHASIPAIVDRFGEGNCHYLVMDYVEGANLEDELAAHGGSLPESRVIEIARELCDVLIYLHGLHPPVIYRDMKPGNVILTPSGRAVLIDFGIARIFTPKGKATLIGTPGFAPPEQYTGQVDERSDIYGLAATLHYLLTGRDPEKQPPFSFVPVHSLKPEASPFLAQAIDKALSYKPEERPQTAAAFKEMFLYGTGIETPRPVVAQAKGATRSLNPVDVHFTTSFGEPQAPPTRAPRRKGRWKRRLFALLLLGVTLTGGYQIFTHPQWLDGQQWRQWGEQLPWDKIEIWLPERGKVWLRKFVADLPWEREKRLQALREDPAELVSLKVFNSSRDGTPLPGQKSSYLESEVKYLTWEATFKNRLAGVEGYNYRLEGQFVDPDGGVAGKSEANRFARPDEPELSLHGVTLLEGLKERTKGNYQVNVYVGGKKLGSQTIRIDPEPKKAVAPPASPVREAAATTTEAPPVDASVSPAVKSPPPEVAALEEKKRIMAEAKRQAALEIAREHPLALVDIRLLNTDKAGKILQSQTSGVFESSQVRFIAWEVKFKNNLYNLAPSVHRVEGTYHGPKGQIIGTVAENKPVGQDLQQISFTARLGNSVGGAFDPGLYRIDFYLDGYPLVSREFVVNDDRGGRVAAAPVPSVEPSASATFPARGSQVFTGSILGIVPDRETSLEIDLQQQEDGRVSGRLAIREPGYGSGIISDGRTNGRRINFEGVIGRTTYRFEGWREEDRLNGTYRALNSEERGKWSVKASDRPSS